MDFMYIITKIASFLELLLTLFYINVLLYCFIAVCWLVLLCICLITVLSSKRRRSSTVATDRNNSTVARSGNFSTVATSRNFSTAATSGDYSTAATSGYDSTAATSGCRSTAATSGYHSKAATSGDYSTAATSGNYSTAKALGKNSAAVAVGKYSTVEVAKGSVGVVIGEEFTWVAHPGAVVFQKWDDGDAVLRWNEPSAIVLVNKGKIENTK